MDECNFSKVGGKVTLLYGCFSRFLNCTNGTKSRNAPHMIIYMQEQNQDAPK